MLLLGAVMHTLGTIHRYTPQEGGKALPLCATQYFPSSSSDSTGRQAFNRVTLGEADPISRANAADLAYAWSKGKRGGREGGQRQRVWRCQLVCH